MLLDAEKNDAGRRIKPSVITNSNLAEYYAAVYCRPKKPLKPLSMLAGRKVQLATQQVFALKLMGLLIKFV